MVHGHIVIPLLKLADECADKENQIMDENSTALPFMFKTLILSEKLALSRREKGIFSLHISRIWSKLNNTWEFIENVISVKCGQGASKAAQQPDI